MVICIRDINIRAQHFVHANRLVTLDSPLGRIASKSGFCNKISFERASIVLLLNNHGMGADL